MDFLHTNQGTKQMDFVKHNQLLKIRVEYDQEYGHIEFEEFVKSHGLERLSDWAWLKFGNPDDLYFAPDDLKTPTDVYEALEEVAYGVDGFAMPELTDEEFETLFAHVVNEEWQEIDIETARRGLLSMTHQNWYDSLNHYNDLRDILAPYTYKARGYSQGDVSHLYLIGMDEHEAESLTKAFEQYAYECPYRYSVELIDCETGETITDEALFGIYDGSFDLRYLKCELKATLNGMGEIHPELRDIALEAVAEIDYTDINQ